MERFFNIDNPIWKFIGNIADMFLLSVLWYICLITIIPAGCGTSAVYYVTLKITTDLEGQTLTQFFKSFKENFKQSTIIWIPSLLIMVFLFIDIKMTLLNTSVKTFPLVIFFAVCIVVVFTLLSMVFPLIARCKDDTLTQLKNCVKIGIKNPLAVFSVALIHIAMFLMGLFVFWPLLLIAPGFSAYINSYVINHIFKKYSLDLQ